MNQLAGIISALENSLPVSLILIGAVIFLMFQIAGLAKDIKSIDEKLGNHIGDTNKKIDNLSNRIDTLSDRFDRLYEILLQDRTKK